MPAIEASSGFDRARAACAAAIVAFFALAPVRAAEFVTLAPFDRALPEPIRAADLDGAPLAITAEPERTVLVHFFASWCEPCAEELPSLATFARSRPDAIRLVGVNVAEPASRAKKFAARFDLPGAVALDEAKDVAKAFGVRGLPATVMIAPGGARALAATGPVDWNAPSTVEALNSLNPPKPEKTKGTNP